MDIKYIILILVGILIIMFPKYIRLFRVYELGTQKNKNFVLYQRITGAFFIIIGIVLIIFSDGY